MKQTLLAVTVFLCSVSTANASSFSKEEQISLAGVSVQCATVGNVLIHLGEADSGKELVGRFSAKNLKPLTKSLSPKDWDTVLEGNEDFFPDTPENRKLLKARKAACMSFADDLGLTM